MFTFLVLIEIILALVLITAVLLQSSKGSGLAAGLGGGNIGTVFGVRRTSDFLSKATSYIATAFIVLCIVINLFFLPGKGRSSQESVIQTNQSSVPPAQLPQSQPAPAGGQQQSK